MALNHDMIRKAVEAHKAKTGHDAQYYDGGAEKSPEIPGLNIVRKEMLKDRERRTKMTFGERLRNDLHLK